MGGPDRGRIRPQSAIALTSAIALILELSGSLQPAAAQNRIVPDASLGEERSRLNGNVIEGGSQRGNNLFHSFEDFQVGNGNAAIFLSPRPDIQNIIARITGSNRSEILGRLEVLEAVTRSPARANLFLINPNGILFGPNASLNLGGSFIATSASALEFQNQGSFSATQPTQPPLLTVNPSALLFTQQLAGRIENRSILPLGSSPGGWAQLSGLRVPDGRSLLLVGGDVVLEGGSLIALGGRIELGGLAAAGRVELNAAPEGFSLGFPAGVPRSNVSLRNSARASVRGIGGGHLVVFANQLEARDGGRLQAGTEGTGDAGDLVVDSTAIALSGVGFLSPSGLFNQVLPNASGNGGNIRMTTHNLQLSYGAQLNLATFGTGNAGNLEIVGSGVMHLIDSQVGTVAVEGATGNAGSIMISTDTLQLENSAIDSSIDPLNPASTATSGNIRILTNGAIALNRRSSIATTAQTGNAGSVAITTQTGAIALTESDIDTSSQRGNAGTVTLRSGAGAIAFNQSDISAQTLGPGNGGDVDLNALEEISLIANSNIFTDTRQGISGDITVNGRSLVMTDQSRMTTFSRGQASGAIAIQTRDVVRLEGDSSLTTFAASPSAIAGDIVIRTGRLQVLNGSDIFNTSAGNQPPALLRIEAAEAVEVAGFLATERLNVSSVGADALTGTSGTLEIITPRLSLREGGRISSSTFGSGTGGNIVIRGADLVEIIGSTPDGLQRSGIDTRIGGTGSAGDIQIFTQRLVLQDGGRITASNIARGNGGSILITATESVRLSGANLVSSFRTEASEISAESFQTGTAGAIQITTPDLRVENGALISTSTVRGQGGTIDITAARVEIAGRNPFFPTSPIGSRLVSRTQGSGNAGTIRITADDLTLRNPAAIETTTGSSGTAGDIVLQISDRLTLSGRDSRLFANAAFGSTGRGGSIVLTPRGTGQPRILLQGGARIAVTSQGSGAAGDIQMQAGVLVLQQQSTVQAEAGEGQGGNIRLHLGPLLLLRNGSSISTTAGNNQTGGDGGNLQINSRYLVAVPAENSDIRANAFTGRGGNVEITAESVIGIEPRLLPTAQSDITASSELGIQGTVTINTPNLDPSRGLTALPDLVDAPQQVAQSCPNTAAEAARLSQFFYTGRSGLPPTLEQSPGDRGLINQLATLPIDQAEPPSSAAAHRPQAVQESDRPTSPPLREAQGWLLRPDGSVELVEAIASTRSTRAQIETGARPQSQNPVRSGC